MLEERLSRQQLFTLLVKHLQRPTPHHEINVCSWSITIFFYYWIDQWICILIYILLIYTCNQFSVSSTANSNLYYRLLLLLSVDICPYPGSCHNLQPLDHDEWNIYKHRGLYCLHLHIISLLPKIDELRHIGTLTNAAIIKISESKFDYMYDLLRCDRNRHGEGIACYIRNDLSYNVKSYFPKDRKHYLNCYYQTLN